MIDVTNTCIHASTSERESQPGTEEGSIRRMGFSSLITWEGQHEDLDFHRSKLGRGKDISTYQLLRRWLNLTIIMTIITQMIFARRRPFDLSARVRS